MSDSKGTILITGGNGLVGMRLTAMLLAQGFTVRHLSTSIGPSRADDQPLVKGEVSVYGWNPAAGSINPNALEGVDHIVNLAGASIAKRWTAEHRELIRSSRVDSLRTLYEALAFQEHQVSSLISSSAVGFYPSSLEHVYCEDDEPSHDFLGEVCQEWEAEAKRFEDLGLRAVLLRTGIVLAESGGALPVIARTVKWFLGAPLGSGKQVMPWIHLDDLCRMYSHALNSGLKGAYNAVGIKGATNAEMTRGVARALKRPVWPINVPAFVLKAVLGDQSRLVLMSTACSPEKMIRAGFTYRYSDLDVALIDILL
ncbi:MAG: TIGR01777 family oxidoreductase [Flavobacteriales bacterium]|nr:TIGR01777 family oxidoreductase [Flavobacteriales bacterium]